MNNIMLDLEALGTNIDAPIIAIGAVLFDESGLGDEFYQVIDINSALQTGAKVDGDTIKWWMQQSDDARSIFKDDGIHINSSLIAFSSWAIDKADYGIKMWGNGAAFDNAILSNAYKRSMISQPWDFWNDRCYRTMKNMYPEVEFERTGTHHNALDDAKSQALHLIEIMKRIK